MPEVSLEKIKKGIEEKKKTEEKGKALREKPFETVDMEQVERIVEKMKKKYSEEGLSFEEVGGKLSELRGIIAEEKHVAVQIQRVEELQEFKSPAVKNLGSFYLKLRGLTEPLKNLLQKFPQVKELGFYLYSANMRFSVQQYLALATSVSLIVSILAFIISLFFFALLKFQIALIIPTAILIALIAFVFSAVISFLYPRSKAIKRGEAVSIELPFALRHMATELKAGIGLYRALQAIATADYGALSEEFSHVITEIEEGTDAKDALRHLALRTQSRSLRIALTHMVRALRTGGNLSEVMNAIAENVSFELRNKIREFSEKMNFFGVIFIFIAIVVPVFVAILGSIRNAPLGVGGQNLFERLPLDPIVISIIFLVIMPFLLGYLIFYMKVIQPRI